MTSQPAMPVQEAGSHPSMLKTMYTIAGSIASSVSIILVNKYVLNNGFPYATSLTALHQLFGWMFTAGLIHFGAIPPLPAQLPLIEGTLLGGSYALGIVMTNQSLKLNPISIYQLLKMTAIPTLAIIQFMLYRTTLSSFTTLALTVIILGVSISTMGDSHFSGKAGLLGLFFGVGGMISGCLSQIWLQSRPSMKVYQGIHTVAVISPYAFWVTCVGALFVDGGDFVFSSRGESIQLNTFLDGFVSMPLNWVLLSCLLGIATNLFAFALIQTTSAITFQVVGHFKTMLTIIFGVLIFHNDSEITVKKAVGVLVTLVGMVMYSQAKVVKSKEVAARPDTSQYSQLSKDEEKV